jgi:hypothetical protein
MNGRKNTFAFAAASQLPLLGPAEGKAIQIMDILKYR